MRFLLLFAAALLFAACSPGGEDRAPEPRPPAAEAGAPLAAPDSMGGERLVDRYLGLVHPPLPAEVIKRGGSLATAPGEDAATASFAFEDVSVGGTRMLWLAALERRNAEGEAVWRVVDAVEVPRVGADERLLITGCRADEQAVAAVAAAAETETLTDIRRAWRVDREAERLAAVDPAGVRCENEGLRAP